MYVYDNFQYGVFVVEKSVVKINKSGEGLLLKVGRDCYEVEL